MVFKLSVITQELFQGVIIYLSLKIVFQCDLVVDCRYLRINRKVKVIKM